MVYILRAIKRKRFYIKIKKQLIFLKYIYIDVTEDCRFNEWHLYFQPVNLYVISSRKICERISLFQSNKQIESDDHCSQSSAYTNTVMLN